MEAENQYVKNHAEMSALLDDMNALIHDWGGGDEPLDADVETMAGILACMRETHRRLSEWVNSPPRQAQREAEAAFLTNLIASLEED